MTLLPLPELGTTPACVLTVAGSDSGGGAGIEAELRTFALTGIHGLVALTAVTAQNTLGVAAIHALPASFVVQQIKTVHEDIGFAAVKTGMMANKEIIEQVASYFRDFRIGNLGHVPLIVDPISASMHGHSLLNSDALDAMKYELLPLANIATPNLDEVFLFTGIEVKKRSDVFRAAESFLDLGVHSVIIKGGHAKGLESIDYFFLQDRDTSDPLVLAQKRIANNGNDHGGGDTFAAAITAALAVGYDLVRAVEFAKKWVTAGLAAAYNLGHGHGPVNAMWRLYE